MALQLRVARVEAQNDGVNLLVFAEVFDDASPTVVLRSLGSMFPVGSTGATILSSLKATDVAQKTAIQAALSLKTLVGNTAAI